jgi:1-acyl-sn-glycerol-3-phosphate acyltransferase
MTPPEDTRALSVAPPDPLRAARILPRRASALAARAFDSPPLLYRPLRAAVAPLVHRLFDLRVAGLEHVPASGPFILAANHHNYLDGVVLGVALPRPLGFLVMPRVYRASPLHPMLHRLIGSIRVEVDHPDPGALKRALRRLAAGHPVCIFPEGPFSKEGRLVRGRPGVATLAMRSGVPVVPAAIRGTFEALAGRRFYLPRRQPVEVRFGVPLRFGALASERGQRVEITRRIMAEIERLLAASAPAAPVPAAATAPAASSASS